MLPEEQARVKIDKQLKDAGWDIVSREEYVPKSTSAIKEALMQGNTESDYLLFVDDKAIAVVEAKKAENPLGKDVAQLLELLYHGWYNEIDDRTEDGYHKNQRDDDGQCTHLDMQAILHECHYGIEQIGKEPCHEEGQQHTAQIVYQIEYGQDEQPRARPPDELVKCDFLSHDVYLLKVPFYNIPGRAAHTRSAHPAARACCCG